MVDRLPMDFILQKPHRGVADAELLKDLGHKCFGFTKMDAGAIRGIKKSAFGSGAGSRGLI